MTNVSLNPSHNKPKKIVGRGGKGKTAGRGRKGWKARSAKARPLPGYEGGQSGILKAIPKLGIQKRANHMRVNMRPLSLDSLQCWIDQKRIDGSKPITIKDICLSGVAGKVKSGVSLLAFGANNFHSKIDIHVTKASFAAVKRIEQLGGSVTTEQHNKEIIRSRLSPHLYIFNQ